MLTTPEQQRVAAEAARKEGQELAEKEEKKPIVSEATGTGAENLNKNNITKLP